ncbi:DUF1761 domain-containing protein [Demequina pelophila]|uniref:DUF1761 domain-containing protein n=1 Tax=Demequina pelophila TaxID=1638984 RepID=UPI000781785C|nr:DUF1761 domain-containing protein [Demequina pelophila]
MDWLSLADVNWIAVLVAFLAAFALGFWWYSPVGLFPLWQRLNGMTREDMEGASMGVAFGGTIVANALGVILLAVLMNGLGIDDWAGGLVLGALIGLVFRGGAHALHNGFALRHPGITLIDAAHDTAGLALAGVVIGLF